MINLKEFMGSIEEAHVTIDKINGKKATINLLNEYSNLLVTDNLENIQIENYLFSKGTYAIDIIV